MDEQLEAGKYQVAFQKALGLEVTVHETDTWEEFNYETCQYVYKTFLPLGENVLSITEDQSLIDRHTKALSRSKCSGVEDFKAEQDQVTKTVVELLAPDFNQVDSAPSRRKRQTTDQQILDQDSDILEKVIELIKDFSIERLQTIIKLVGDAIKDGTIGEDLAKSANQLLSSINTSFASKALNFFSRYPDFNIHFLLQVFAKESLPKAKHSQLSLTK